MFGKSDMSYVPSEMFVSVSLIRIYTYLGQELKFIQNYPTHRINVAGLSTP